MKTKVTDVINDAREALMYDRYIEFEEWYPTWMVDESGELMEDPKRLKTLRIIFNRIRKELNNNN